MDNFTKKDLENMRADGLNDCQIIASAICGWNGSAKDTYYYNYTSEAEKLAHIIAYGFNVYDINLSMNESLFVYEFLEKEYPNSSERDHSFAAL